MISKQDKPIPFRVRCKNCGTVAESYHYSNVPVGKTSGMASCECGAIRADSLGIPGKGRIIGDPDGWISVDEGCG